MNASATEVDALIKRIEELNAIGIALSAERDTSHLLEKILISAKRLTNADGGTIYTVSNDKCMRFEVGRNDSLQIAWGGTTGQPTPPFDPIPLYKPDGQPNTATVATYTALTGRPVNIPDAYTAQGFDFTGTLAFDRKTGYRSRSFLTIPMKDHNEKTIGVLQLINALCPHSGQITAFTAADQHFVESLASQASVALTNQRLLDEVRTLLEKFIEMIAFAIDEKSPYTGGHCRRVPELAMMLTEATCAVQCGPFKEFQLSDAQLYEMKIAGLLHDCGKITTPVHVVDKATKLETIFDRIHLIEARFEILKRDAEIAALKAQLCAKDGGAPCNEETAHAEFRQRLRQIDDDLTFLKHWNIGSEHMPPEAQQRVRAIATSYRIATAASADTPLLTDNEVYNLCVTKGTLTPEERKIINDHIVTTIKMLESLPFPEHLRNIPEIAGGHHERMDGKGYPRGLKREQMSVQARIMGIADIFEALTAADRPYKKAMPLSFALTMLGKMKLNGHIDPDLFDVFINNKVYLRYAEKFLSPEQIDEVDLAALPGYTPPAG